MNKYDFINSNKYIDKTKIKDFINTNKNIDESKINDFNTIYKSCKNLADTKLNSTVNVFFAEELSELIQPLLKLVRWNCGDEFLRCEYEEIVNNLYEELADVIIMMLQFVYKNEIDYNKLIDKISEKILRTYETKFGEE